MVNQQDVEFALHLTISALESMKYPSGKQYMHLGFIRDVLLRSLPTDSAFKIKVLKKLEADKPWD